MNALQQPTILVIAGISGDLSRRKLLPAIREIARTGVLPTKFHIVGITHTDISKKEILSGGDYSLIEDMIEVYHMDLTNTADCAKLGEHLNKIDESFATSSQRLFYLAVPPQVAPPIVEHMGESGLLKHTGTKLLLEKPFGTDLASAQDLVEHLKRYCTEDQLYRIDHYMAKEMAQNLVVFRTGNSLIKRTWNKDFIESIHITAAETIGIEGRAAFYEQTGALRDFVQNHLLQLASLVLMDVPGGHDWEDIPSLRLRALEALEAPQDVHAQVKRGQYEGYRDEVGNPDSSAETYVSMRLYSNAERWQGVPITLTTGKALSQKSTTIRIRYRRTDARHANELIMRIQPNEGVTLQMWVKQPGYDRVMQRLPLEMAYGSRFSGLPDAYERVFVDAIRSDRALFTTSDEVLAAWRILKPVQQAWEMSDDDLFIYKSGSSLPLVPPNSKKSRSAKAVASSTVLNTALAI